jgi:PadR family transcriptional regulator
MKTDVLKGHLDALLLAALEDGPQHGYAIMEWLRAGSDGRIDLPTGTVYPALHRLERSGLITSQWSTETGRPRRIYELTAAGRRVLSTERATWHAFSTAMSRLLAPGA